VLSGFAFLAINDAASDFTPAEITCVGSAIRHHVDPDPCFGHVPWYAVDPFQSAIVATIVVTALVWLFLGRERRRRTAKREGLIDERRM
jgi:hypothetical protein